MNPLKIVITGAESSGKTTLTRQLSAQLACPMVSEYARAFFEKKKTTVYVYEDLLKIAQGQIRLENKILKKNMNAKLFILDTDLITIKIWSMVKFGRCDAWILNQIEQRPYDFYLLCSPEGISWEADPLRENPMDRQPLFELYEKELIFYQKKYIILKGNEAERQHTVLNHSSYFDSCHICGSQQSQNN
jgi:NadR type nicotinamide-nucleotide adenylyltransferase